MCGDMGACLLLPVCVSDCGHLVFCLWLADFRACQAYAHQNAFGTFDEERVWEVSSVPMEGLHWTSSCLDNWWVRHAAGMSFTCNALFSSCELAMLLKSGV